MNADAKTALVLAGWAGVFLGAAAAFRADLWGRPEPLPAIPLVDPAFTNTTTVRLSAAELIKSGEDTSGFDCYACHDKKEPPDLHIDAQGLVVLPKEHEDLVMRHGRSNRNMNCYNCHDRDNLDKLKTRDGKLFSFEESTQLCASCHGPTYRDWEIGVHGRVSGYWNRDLGSASRKECASCHHPHAPAFPEVKPAPGPHPLHPRSQPSADGPPRNEH
ncbi:MAG: cytochrome c3 family protein [Verrucomicrobiota bacterium]|jgi:hypothetical protein